MTTGLAIIIFGPIEMFFLVLYILGFKEASEKLQDNFHNWLFRNYY